MAKYEIDFLIKGSLSEAEADAVAEPFIKLINKEKEYKVDKWGSKQLAYKMHGEKSAYFYIFTFESNNSEMLNNFRNLSNLNDKVLRCLIINLEKTYGYVHTVNEKKIAKAKKQKEIYEKKHEEYKKTKNESNVILDSIEIKEDDIENE